MMEKLILFWNHIYLILFYLNQSFSVNVRSQENVFIFAKKSLIILYLFFLSHKVDLYNNFIIELTLSKICFSDTRLYIMPCYLCNPFKLTLFCGPTIARLWANLCISLVLTIIIVFTPIMNFLLRRSKLNNLWYFTTCALAQAYSREITTWSDLQNFEEIY